MKKFLNNLLVKLNEKMGMVSIPYTTFNEYKKDIEVKFKEINDKIHKTYECTTDEIYLYEAYMANISRYTKDFEMRKSLPAYPKTKTYSAYDDISKQSSITLAEFSKMYCGNIKEFLFSHDGILYDDMEFFNEPHLYVTSNIPKNMFMCDITPEYLMYETDKCIYIEEDDMTSEEYINKMSYCIGFVDINDTYVFFKSFRGSFKELQKQLKNYKI